MMEPHLKNRQRHHREETEIMSNIGRPRTGLKACTFCGSTERASNGQCACRNSLYRLKHKAAPGLRDRVGVTFNQNVYNEKAKAPDLAGATAAVLAEFPDLAGRKPAKKAAAKKTIAKKAAASTRRTAPKKAAEPEPKAAEPERYTLVVKDDWTDPKDYARKDAAIKNGVRSGEEWEVTYKGKIVAQSDDLL